MPIFAQPNVTASVNRISQIGVETTPGTPVAATKLLQSGSFELARETDYTTFRPPGFKFDTGSAKLREWASGSFAGGLAYNEFHTLCASALRSTTSTTPAIPAWSATTYFKLGDIIVSGSNRFQVSAVSPTVNTNYPYGGTSGATLPTFVTATPGVSTTTDAQLTWLFLGAATTPAAVAFEWQFDMSTTLPDNVTYFTVERGDRSGGRARRASRARLTGLSVSSSRTGDVSVSADMVAGALQTSGFTMANLGTGTTMIPATPAHLNVYVDNTSAGLGTTQIQGNFSADFSLSDRAAAFFFHGRQLPGIAGFVETSGMGAEANLTQKDDEWVDDALLQLQNGVQRFIRYEFAGPEIGTTGIRNAVIIDMCAQIGDSETESDEDGVFAIQLPYRLQHNGTWGKAVNITVRNGANALA